MEQRSKCNEKNTEPVGNKTQQANTSWHNLKLEVKSNTWNPEVLKQVKSFKLEKML